MPFLFGSSVVRCSIDKYISNVILKKQIRLKSFFKNFSDKLKNHQRLLIYTQTLAECQLVEGGGNVVKNPRLPPNLEPTPPRIETCFGLQKWIYLEHSSQIKHIWKLLWTSVVSLPRKPLLSQDNEASQEEVRKRWTVWILMLYGRS